MKSEFTFTDAQLMLYIARDATLESISVWPEPTSHSDALKMFIEKLVDLIGDEWAARLDGAAHPEVLEQR